jgi:hypothetical protein
VVVRLLQRKGRAHGGEDLGDRGWFLWWRGRSRGDEDLSGGGVASVESQSSW